MQHGYRSLPVGLKAFCPHFNEHVLITEAALLCQTGLCQRKTQIPTRIAKNYEQSK